MDADLRAGARALTPAEEPAHVARLIRAGQTDDPLVALWRCRAFAGCEVARGFLPLWTGEWNDELSLNTWVAVLRTQLRALPGAGVEVPCGGCGGEGRHEGWAEETGQPMDWECDDCDGSGTVRVAVSPEHYLTTVAALAVGRECWAEGFRRNNWAPGLSMNDYDRSREALDACEQWLRCPCDRHLEAWLDVLRQTAVRTICPPWIPRPWRYSWYIDDARNLIIPEAQAAAAAQILTPARVIEAMGAGLLARDVGWLTLIGWGR
jgi:hypothetical protein